MQPQTPLSASALPEAIVSLIWQGDAAGLPKAIAEERARIQGESDALARRSEEIEDARAALAVRLRVLNELSAGRGAAAVKPPPAGSKPLAQAVVKAPAAGKDRAVETARKAPSASASSPSSLMTKPERDARKRIVLDVARRLARKNGGEFTVSELVQALQDEGVVIGVRDSHAGTAVANIVFHSGDADFSLASRGVFRYAPVSKGSHHDESAATRKRRGAQIPN